MKNRHKTLILVALSLVVAFLLARPYIITEKTAEAAKPVKEQLEEAFALDKPLAIVFTYDSECCPGTEAFFEAYQKEARLLLEKYDGIEPVWLNVGVESRNDQNEILALARQYGVTQIPSLLILDKKHEKIGVLVGEINVQDAESLLQEALGT